MWITEKQLYRYHIAPVIRDWLLYSGSMTRRLKKQCSDFKIKVLSSKRYALSPSEAKKLRVPLRSWGWLREVYIYCDNEPWIYGRTVIPYQSLEGQLRRVKLLKTTPLGNLLFTIRDKKRSSFDIGTVCSPHSNSKLSYARRSVFTFGNDNVLLMEIFLPAMENQLLNS